MYISRRLSKELCSFSGLHFPYKTACKSMKPYSVTVGIGGNVGDVKRRFEHLFFFFKREKRVDIQKTSLILKNPPFGYKKQDDFLNAIMLLQTTMQPRAFMRYLLRVEKRFGRKRSFANAPRTLDLDIIFFDNRVIKCEDLIIPHKAWHMRESVVIPLVGVR
jgi:2-amino-4-hydroxy-6-hydroxymethyldihydropteridine diphosphokinase